MAAERAVLTPADADALGRMLAELAYSAYGRQQREHAPQTAEGRAPHQLDARPPETGEEKRGVTSTGRPQRILRDRA